MPLIEDEFEDTLAIVRATGAGFEVAVRDTGALPRIRTAGHHPAEVAYLCRTVRDQLGLDTIVLDCRGVSVADGIARRLLMLESLDHGSATTDLTWVVPSDLRRSLSAELFDVVAVEDWFDQLAEQADRPDGRDWTVPGWWARVDDWIMDKVQGAGLGRVLLITQIRSWEFSCVLLVRTKQEDLYFKALPRSCVREARLADFVAHHHPDLVPGVVAISEGERWLLMRACHGQCLEEGAPPTVWERAAAAYAELQVASTLQFENLHALGCPVRGTLELRTVIGPLLADETALLGQGEHGLSADELRRLRELRPSLESACDDLSDGDIPLALDHGDLWSSNVYVGDDGVQFIDWTEASISHPFFSLTPLLESAKWDVDQASVPSLQARVMAAYLERWTAFSTPERLRRTMTIARPLAALHIATTYWRDIPQPHHQWWIPRMVPFFLRMALELWEGIEDGH